jgi:hypothetical protein
VDAILREVCGRHTVYAREIIDPLSDMCLPRRTNFKVRQHVMFTLRTLQPLVGTINGESYLHFRDFLNPLLDLRNNIKEAT